jgi:hypothetical protein
MNSNYLGHYYDKPTKMRSMHGKIWKDAHGPVPHVYEIRHILPKHAGGTDELSNLEIVTPTEHAERHLKLYKEYGDFRDLCAYRIIGYNFTEARKISSSEGDKLGPKNKGFRWYSDGVNNFKYTPKQQLDLSFEDFLHQHKEYKQGRK